MLQSVVVQRRTWGWVVSTGLVLTGCFYIEPINRRPQSSAPERICDPPAPDDLCTLDHLHAGDRVRLKAVFNDEDGDETNGTAHWKVTPCGRALTECDGGDDRLFDAEGQVIEFTIRPTLRQTPGPVRCVVIAFDVYDERGASSSGELQKPVIQDGAETAPSTCFESTDTALDHQGAAP